MVYLEKKDINGYPYWYAIKKVRINGKPKRLWQLYLGTAERIAECIRASKTRPTTKLKSFQYGKNAALLDVCQDLGFIEVVDKHAKMERVHGLTCGEYMILIIMGRCDKPISKNAMQKWFKKSCMGLLWKFKHKLSSQNFLNHMKRVDKKREKIEDDIAKVLIDVGLLPHSLVLDESNFPTCIENLDGKQKLPQKCKSKQHRNDKNHVALGLVVSAENIPFLHNVYEANNHDSKQFPKILDNLVKRLTKLHVDTESLVLIFDKGNNSEPNIQKVMESMHVLGAVKPDQVKELMNVPLSKYDYLYTNEKGHEIIGYRTKRALFGYDFTIVVTYNKQTYKRQVRTYEKNKQKIFEKLKDLNRRLRSKRSKRDRSSVEREINDIIRKDMRAVVKCNVKKKNSKFKIVYRTDKTAENERFDRFGKNIIFTDMHHWHSKKISKSYNSKYLIEEDFKWFNNDALISLTPIFSRLDKSIRMHVFLCVMGMLFYRYLFWKLRGFKMSGQRILEELEEIRIGVVRQNKSGKGQLVFEEMTPLQMRLFSFLDLGRFIEE